MKEWHELGPVTQAVLRCKSPVFRAFLREQYLFDEAQAAIVVRAICGVSSRAELGKLDAVEARQKWRALDSAYQGWKAMEYA